MLWKILNACLKNTALYYGWAYAYDKLDWLIIIIITIIIIVNISKEGFGISNFKIKKFIEKSSNADLKTNFAEVFASNKINYFANFHHLIRKKGARYPFIISNSDRLDRARKHWWNILDLHLPPTKKRIFFVSFGLLRWKYFIIQDDKKTINTFCLGSKKSNWHITRWILYKQHFQEQTLKN